MRDPNIVRWIMASCRVFFESRRADIPLYYEYTGPKPKDNEVSYAEFRLDGPYYRMVSGSEEWYDVEINIISVTHVIARYTDTIERMNGIWLAAFEKLIPVCKYGDGPDDTGDQIGCLILQQDDNDTIQVSRFGQANADTRIIQASVEGHYRMKVRT